MQKYFLILLTILFSIATTEAQNISISNNGALPHASAMLDIKSSNKGLLIPRVSLLSETDVITIVNPQTSLLIYNTNAALPDGEGHYFWNDTKWSKFATRNNLANLVWNVAGNSSTNTLTDFIGTIDNKPLIFKTNNILSGKIDPGPNNVFFGQKAGNVTTGSNNSFFGHTAGEINSTGDNNTAVGNSALSLNTTGFENTAVGSFSLDSNTFGENNTAFGVSALRSNTTKPNNTAIGVRAFFSQKGGFTGDNVAVGYEAGKDIPNCNGCTFIGANSGVAFTTSPVTEAAAFGEGAISDGSFTMMFGSTNVSKWGFGRTSVASFRAIEVGDDANSGNGAYLSSGGVWTNASDVNKKEDFTDLNATDLLQKISELKIQRWKYKGSNEYHIGPMAQDFYKLFSLGVDDKGISTVDPSGIALAVIKELQKKIELIEKQHVLQQEQIGLLEKQNIDLRKEVVTIHELLLQKK